ncbi:DEAD/DEAH box helicase [Fuscibacter oryzae]|uniref:DEAD/DEAH box helicase n=1 Tax=Fuscibacter oryzae TaxID=2803939 RepID=A0A8J7MUA1_9RHOB|nr:DEAD/DEAH box helicase [Fuscibacter oryzae]MBL4929140.1 DEAD/DEAH box helicase [Fuscibacter oryzae]
MTDMMLAAPLAAALSAKGYDSLTPVQEAVSAPALAGRDLLVSAQTGSGKTVAFGLAISPEILNGQDTLLFADKPIALVVAPTRELALQVAREFEWLYGPAGAHLATCVGGMDYRTERRALDRGAHVVVGTPGRLRDHIERGSLDLSQLKAVVLDEADEMLDLGFAEDLEFILGAAPETRRTLMFSATVPKEIEKLARTFQRDAARVQVAGESRQHIDISYQALSVLPRDKEHAIFNVLRLHESQTAIVFCKTRANVNHLFARMGNRGFQVVALSGELSQAERSHALQALRDGRARVCIATDVAARGIDLPGLELVIHADLPTNPETLLHRSGRTGRAGKKGTSVLIVPPAEFKKASRILQAAQVTAEWGKPPSADEVQAKDDERLVAHPILSIAAGEEADLANTLLDTYGAEQVAAAFIRLWREGRSAPEVLSDAAVPTAAAAPARPRGEFGASVWFRLSVGHTGRAEARWLLPKICDAGGIAKDSIGAIRVQQDQSFVQIAEAMASRFGTQTQLDTDLVMDRIEGEPDLDARPARPERKPYGSARPERAERTERAPRPERSDRAPYTPKPPRFVEDGETADAPTPRKPYTPREDGDRKPYTPREDRKPYAPRDGAERKPYAPRADGDRKPYTPRAPREDGERKPYAPREGAERKPYAPRADGDRKPYAPREATERRPYAPREERADADRKPRWSPDDKKTRSTGFKSHGGSADKPARSGGYKSHSAEGGARPARPDGEKRPYAPKGDDARPFVKREGAPAKPGGFKSRDTDGKKPFARAKPAAAPKDARDTSKRFTPPKKPRG